MINLEGWKCKHCLENEYISDDEIGVIVCMNCGIEEKNNIVNTWYGMHETHEFQTMNIHREKFLKLIQEKNIDTKLEKTFLEKYDELKNKFGEDNCNRKNFFHNKIILKKLLLDNGYFVNITVSDSKNFELFKKLNWP